MHDIRPDLNFSESHPSSDELIRRPLILRLERAYHTMPIIMFHIYLLTCRNFPITL
jgi:hypothetical protein